MALIADVCGETGHSRDAQIHVSVSTLGPMDPLVGLLDGPRARGAFVLRSIQDPPWSVQVQDNAPLSIVAIARGDPWVVPRGGDAVRLHPEDVAIMRGPDPYTFTDDPAHRSKW